MGDPIGCVGQLVQESGDADRAGDPLQRRAEAIGADDRLDAFEPVLVDALGGEERGHLPGEGDPAVVHPLADDLLTVRRLERAADGGGPLLELRSDLVEFEECVGSDPLPSETDERLEHVSHSCCAATRPLAATPTQGC